MKDIIIRSASEGDLATLCELYSEFHEFHARAVPEYLRSLAQPGEQDCAELSDKLREMISGDHSTILVAEHAGAIAGLVEVYLRQDNASDPAIVAKRYGYIQSLVVTEPVRRQGVGEQLTRAAHVWAREKGASEMRLGIWEFAGDPLRFYEKLGYRTIKRTLALNL